jgi:hypothetical protein
MEQILEYDLLYGIGGTGVIRLRLERTGWTDPVQVNANALAATLAIIETGIAGFDRVRGEFRLRRSR